jgi:predicted DCC family thiol-disulfide oxidoreductase YuxK
MSITQGWNNISKAWLELAGQKRNPAMLGVFRILFFGLLGVEVFQFWQAEELIFNFHFNEEVGFWGRADWHNDLLFFFWGASLLLIVVGWPTKLFRILNWIFCVSVFQRVHFFEYHMFYAWTGVSFLSIFLHVNNAFSVHVVWEQMKAARQREGQAEFGVPLVDFILILLVTVGFVYADSVLYKLGDSGWVQGYGLSRALAQPFASTGSFLGPFTLKFFGFVTLAFEALFVFLFIPALLRPRLGFALAIIGMVLHLGIAWYFPIPLFGIGYAVVYLLFLSSKDKAPYKFIPTAAGRLTFYFDNECPLCRQTVAFLQVMDLLSAISFVPVQQLEIDGEKRDTLLRDIHVQWSGREKMWLGADAYAWVVLVCPLLWGLIPFLWLWPLNKIARGVYKEIALRRGVERCTFESCSLPKSHDSKDWFKLLIGFDRSELEVKAKSILLLVLMVGQILISSSSGILSASSAVSGVVEPPLRVFFGLTHHPVFMSGHFSSQTHIGRLKCEKGDVVQYYPSIDDRVQTQGGFLWVAWTFRAQNFQSDPKKEMLKRWMSYYSLTHNCDTVIYENALLESFKNEDIARSIISPWKPSELTQQ